MAFRVSLLIPLTKKSNLSGIISPSIYLPKSFLASLSELKQREFRRLNTAYSDKLLESMRVGKTIFEWLFIKLLHSKSVILC